MSLNSAISQNIRTQFKTDAKGLEKILFKSSFFIASTANYLNTLFYGKGAPKSNGKTKRFSNPLDLGIIPLLDIINSVDVCDLLNYGVNKLANVSTGKKFNPNEKPTTAFGKVKWRFQKTAFDVQADIDGFYNDFENLTTPQSRVAVLSVLASIRNSFSSFTSALTETTNTTRFSEIDPDISLILDAFPQLKNIGNYVNDKLRYFDTFTDPGQFTNNDIKKIDDTIKKIRQYCILIQSLDEPAAIATQLVTSTFTSNISKLADKIDVTKMVPTLKKLNASIKSTISICQKINNIITTSRVMIRTFLSLIRVFKIIINFLTAILPLPNMFTTVGITNKFADAVNTVKEKGPTTLEARVKQVVVLLETISMLLTSMLPMLTDAMTRINTLLANIDRCDDKPEDLLNEMRNNALELEKQMIAFQDFLNTKEQNDLTRSDITQFGEYTIQIITEEVIEEARTLRRRYGIALNRYGILTVSSQPTFASDDLIIINEVKLLLREKGVKVELDTNYTQSELDLLNDAAAYLEDSNVDFQIPEEEVDSLSLEDEGDTNSTAFQDASSFIGGLKRGKAFRRRARARMIRERQKLQERLRGA